MVQRTGQQGQGKIFFVQNNFYYDAFFLKAIGKFSLSAEIYAKMYCTVLNGACNNGWCETPNTTQRYQVRYLLYLNQVGVFDGSQSRSV